MGGIEGEPPRKPVVDVAVHLGELPGPPQNFGFVIAQPEQPRGEVESVRPVAGDAVNLLRPHLLRQPHNLRFRAAIHPDHRRAQRPAGAVQGQQGGRLAAYRQPENALGSLRNFGQRRAHRLAGAAPPIVGVLFHPGRPDVVQRILRLARRVQGSPRVDQRGLDGTGPHIDAQEQRFHTFSPIGRLVGGVKGGD